MKNHMFAALFALAVAVPCIATARDDEPSPEAVREWGTNYMQQLAKQKLSDREIANQLASSILWSEKIQLICPSFFFVNTRAARLDYLLRQGAWTMMFGPGKTSTSILNEASARRNEEFNNAVSKKDWCEGIKVFGTKAFGWAPLFQPDGR